MSRLTRILEDRRFHIEFNGHLTHHGKHAAIALDKLGLPKESVEKYYEDYCALTPYGMGLEPWLMAESQTVTQASLNELLGKRRSFAGLFDFFTGEIRRMGLDAAVVRYVPQLLPGWVGSLTHPAIHLGFALNANSTEMAAEGLAYWVFSYVPMHPERLDISSTRGVSPLEAFIEKLDRYENAGVALEIENIVTDQSPEACRPLHPELQRSGLQYRLARLMAEGHEILYGSPSFLQSTCWREMYEFVTTAYLAKPGDFVLMHLLTSLHALEIIAQRFPDSREILKHYWLGSLVLIFGGGSCPRKRDLLRVSSQCDSLVDNPSDPEIIKQWSALAVKSLKDPEEHNCKLVYVMKQEWEKSGFRSLYRMAAAQFTRTPVLSFQPSPPRKEFHDAAK